MALPSVLISFVLDLMHPRTRLVYFYFLRVNFLVKTSTSGRRDQVRLPWQRYTCQSKYGCFYSSPQVTYLYTKNDGVLQFFISNFASLSRRMALNTFIIMNKSRILEVPKNNGLIFHMGEVLELWRKAMVKQFSCFQF